jgi:uncharacterized protein
MDNTIKYLNISWNQIDKYCDKITNDIKKAKISFDIIVSVGRGGMIPARILSDRLNIYDIQLFPIRLYKTVNQRNNKPTMGNLSVDIQGKNILLVDDILDSGVSIESTINYMNSKKPNSIKSAMLLCKKSNKRKPTFFGEECDDDAWIIFPWECTEFSDAQTP